MMLASLFIQLLDARITRYVTTRIIHSGSFDRDDIMVPYDKPSAVEDEYSQRFKSAKTIGNEEYVKKMTELLRKPITSEEDPMLKYQELFTEGVTAKGTADPTFPLVVIEGITNNTVEHYLEH